MEKHIMWKLQPYKPTFALLNPPPPLCPFFTTGRMYLNWFLKAIIVNKVTLSRTRKAWSTWYFHSTNISNLFLLPYIFADPSNFLASFGNPKKRLPTQIWIPGICVTVEPTTVCHHSRPFVSHILHWQPYEVDAPKFKHSWYEFCR